MPLIRCKLHRNGGSNIQFGEGKARVNYHFKPVGEKPDMTDDRLDHVCQVDNPEHAARLLEIKEGYELVEGEKAPSAPKSAQSAKSSAKAKKVTNAGAGSAVPTPPSKEIAKMNKGELMAAVTKKHGGKAPHPSTSAARLREILSQPGA